MRSALLAIAAATCLIPAWAVAADLEVGQTRACQSSGPGKQLYVTIGRIEPYANGQTVVSVSLFNRAPGAAMPSVAHAPVDANVLSVSCPILADHSIPLSPEFDSGYQQWRTAQGGVFTIPIDQIYDIGVETVAKSHQGGSVAL